MIITVSSDLESVLHDVACKQGVPPEDLALDALREHFLAPTAANQPREEWEGRLLEAGTDCGVAVSHEAVSSEGLYD